MTHLTKVLHVMFFTITLLTIFFLSRIVTAGITSGDKIKTNSVNRKYRIDGTATKPEQIPICMIGDSITWAQLGDNWRKLLLEHIPTLAFVGTHTGMYGYSHAAEGGDSTFDVLDRIDDIPDCPYYSLLIGTNDPANIENRAERIEKIVNSLLEKPSAKKVFLSSILPCYTTNPSRDVINSKTNELLREKMKTRFPKDKVIFIEYEKPIRATDNWQPLILLHPTVDGYKLIAKIMADRLKKEFKLDNNIATPTPKPNTGVIVRNVWEGNAEEGQTKIPLIAGWYTVSFYVDEVAAADASVLIQSQDASMRFFSQKLDIMVSDKGTQKYVNIMTGYEGYGYERSKFELKLNNCKISKVVFEKMRPTTKPSIYSENYYIDDKTPPTLGELVVYK